MISFGISFLIKPNTNRPVVVFSHFRYYITRFPALSVLNQLAEATDIYAFAQTPNIDLSDRRYFNKVIVAVNFLTIQNMTP